MSGNTRSSQEPVFALKTDLQRHRDSYGFKIQKKWPAQGDRPHLDPRVFAANGTHNYQYVVHQALMHTPIFVNWILSHNSPDVLDHDGADCMMCEYKLMAQEYWLNDGPENLGAQQPISDAATAADAQLFPAHASGDVAKFYEWVINEMIWAVPDEPITSADSWKTLWNEEMSALFTLDLDVTTSCEVCGRENNIQGPWLMMDLFMMSHEWDLASMVDDWWDELREPECETCNTRTVHRIEKKIVAAPQVLTIKVQLWDKEEDGRIVKCSQPVTVPQKLDLRLKQLNSQLPLTYTLSSAIAHGGDGGCREDFGRDALSGDGDVENEGNQNAEEAAHEADNNDQAEGHGVNDDVQMQEGEDNVAAQERDENDNAVPVPNEDIEEDIATPNPIAESNATPKNKDNGKKFSNAPNAPRAGRRGNDIEMPDVEEEQTPRSRRRDSIFVFDGLVEVTGHDPLDMLESESDEEEQPAAPAQVKQASWGRRVIRKLNPYGLERRTSSSETSSDDTLAAESSSDDFPSELSDTSDDDMYGAPSSLPATVRGYDRTGIARAHDFDAESSSDKEVNEAPQPHPYFGAILNYTDQDADSPSDSPTDYGSSASSDSIAPAWVYGPVRRGNPQDLISRSSSSSDNEESEDESSSSSNHNSHPGNGGGGANLRRCGGCGQVGHIKTNKKLCPLHNGGKKQSDDAEPSASEPEDSQEDPTEQTASPAANNDSNDDADSEMHESPDPAPEHDSDPPQSLSSESETSTDVGDDVWDHDQGRYAINVVGRAQGTAYHASEAHFNAIAPGSVTDNPQRPTDVHCVRPNGYQVVVLTYTRDKLTGHWAKLEKDIPAW